MVFVVRQGLCSTTNTTQKQLLKSNLFPIYLWDKGKKGNGIRKMRLPTIRLSFNVQ